MFSRPLLLNMSVYNSTTTITRMYVLRVTVINSVYNSTTTITRMFVLKATVIKSVRLQQYYYHHMNLCSLEHCYSKCQFTTVLLLSHECIFSRPLLLKVSVYNSTTTVRPMYVLKNTFIKRVSLQRYYYYHTYHRMYVLKGTVIKSVSLQELVLLLSDECTQFCRIKGCGGSLRLPAPIIFERLKLPQQIIYRRKQNLSESRNHKKYWENILVSRFYEQFSRNRRNLGHFRKFEKISFS